MAAWKSRDVEHCLRCRSPVAGRSAGVRRLGQALPQPRQVWVLKRLIAPGNGR